MDSSGSGRSSRAVVLGKVLVGAITCALILGIGLYGGWVAGRQGGAGGGGAHGEGEHAPHAATPALSPQTLANLGVEFALLVESDFVRTREVAAVVEARPDGLRPVHAPVAGRVTKTFVGTGHAVRAGDPIAEIVRDPFPRPVLVLTDAVLKPLNEDFHRAIADVHTAAGALEVVREELARIRRVLGAASLSGTAPALTKTEIDLGYEERRATRVLERARTEARRHGLSDQEIAGLEAGTVGEPEMPPLRSILEHSRLWSPSADDLLALLPPAVRSAPFASAVLGELVGTGLLTPELVALVRARPALAVAFLDWVGLVQQGETVARIAALDDLGALAPTFVVRAPADAPDWDLVALSARTGAHVTAGVVLATVEDPRTIVLRLALTGGDVELTEKALVAGASLTAEPLVDGAETRLDGVRLRRMATDPDGGHAVTAIAEVVNRVLAETGSADAGRSRTWALRPGMRFLVHVPVGTLVKRFVLRSDAVIPRGADSVVVVKQGPSYVEVPVRVEYSDAHVAVVANDGAVFAGDTVASRGAYALSLALQAGKGGAVDPHAGHHH